MFERFTDRARKVVVLAQEEARLLDHNYIGTEHILLGLIHEGRGVGAKALESLGISLEAVRQQVEEIIGVGKHTPSGHIPFTPRAKKVLEGSLRESILLGHNYIGTEHILLGLIREGEGVAAQVLVRLGADLNRVRLQVIELLAGHESNDPEGRTVRARPPGPPMRLRPEEFISMLSDISARVSAIEEHLGIRQPAEGGRVGRGGGAEPGEVKSGEAGAGEVEDGEVESGEVKPGAVESGEFKSGEAGAGEVESGAAGAGDPGPADRGEVKSGEAGAGEVESGAAGAGGVDPGPADRGEVNSGEAGAGEVESGAAGAGAVESGEVKSGAAGAGAVESGEARPGAAEPGSAGPGDEPGHGPDSAEG
jgi:hypothetical protein